MNKLPDKIHYQIFDNLGRVERVLLDNDNEQTTGKTQADNAGENVAGIDQVLKYEYNVKGERTSMQRDNNVDGKYDYRDVYTLDANGRQTVKDIDLTNDGKFDRKEVYTREADGGLVQTNFSNIDGSKETLYRIDHYELNANNQRTQLSRDLLGDGTINSTERYDLDGLGRVVKAYYDTNNDKVIDRIENRTFDNIGNILRNEITNADGDILTVRTYERNALGQVLQSDSDEGNDGIIDTRYEYTRDIQGNELTYKLYSYNAVSQQLELTQSVEREFNEQNQAKYAQYSFADSSRDHRIDYSYDEFGRKISDLFSGSRTGRWDYIYNNDGLVYERLDYNAKGDYTSKTVYMEYYPELNNAVKVLEAYDANNQLVNTALWLRNNNGDLTNSLIDLANNGKGWDTFTFGDRGASTSFNISQDFTKWSQEQLATLGDSLSLIRMGNGGVTELTLNTETLAKISNGGLRVQGAADKNDVLNLSGFEKAASSTVKGYDLYTGSFEGEDLNLYVQANDSITVNNIIG